jgi:hypothetical protein
MSRFFPEADSGKGHLSPNGIGPEEFVKRKYATHEMKAPDVEGRKRIRIIIKNIGKQPRVYFIYFNESSISEMTLEVTVLEPLLGVIIG